MKVLHVSRRFSPLTGGTERYIQDITQRLTARGVESRVLTLKRDVLGSRSFPGRDRLDGVDIVRVPHFGGHKKPIPLRIPVSLFRWAEIVHSHDPRVFYETTLALKPLFRYKIVFSTHGFILHTSDLQAIKNILIPHYFVPTLKSWIDAVVADSEQDYEYFAKRGLGNLHLVTNGVDAAAYGSVRRQPQTGRLLYFGRIDQNKGIGLLLSALSLLPGLPWTLHVVGSGPEKIETSLRRQAEELGIADAVVWHGTVTESQKLEFLGSSHLCLFPSTYEGFGLTLLEAMAAGCVCVVNDIPPYRRIVTAEADGVIVDFGKKHEAARRVRELLKAPPSQLARLQASARRKAEANDWDIKVDELLSVYRSVL